MTSMPAAAEKDALLSLEAQEDLHAVFSLVSAQAVAA